MPQNHNRAHEIHTMYDDARVHEDYRNYDAKPSPPAQPPEGVADLLGQVQAHVAELTRSRESLAGAMRELENQLAKANAELGSLRGERDHLARLKGLYERKFTSIRELAQQ